MSLTVTEEPHCPTESVHTGQRPLLPVVGADVEVPLVQGGQTRYVNLDYAASAPALCSVAGEVAEFLPYYSSVHRGAGYLSQVSTVSYEDARAAIGAFFGARDDDVVVLTRNTTDALNLLASAVPGPVVHCDIEHHANLLPWGRGAARAVPAEPTWEQTLAAVGAALASEPVALLAVTGASNVTGERPDLVALAELAHAHGARIAVDAAQLAPHRRVDIAALGVDYLAASGHKLYAPYGAGVLIGRRDWLDAAPPYLAGGGAVRAVTLEGVDWASAPARHEAGTPNVVGAVAFAAACRAIGDLPTGALAEHERALTSHLRSGVDSLGLHVLQVWPDGADPIGIATFTVPGRTPSSVAAYLSAEHGIGVRDGRFCAHPLLRRLGNPDGAIRISLGVGSSTADVDGLVAALRALATDGPRWHYARVDGESVPDPETRRLPTARGGGLLDSAGAAASPCTRD